MTEPQLSMKSGPSPPAYMFSGNDISMPIAPGMLSNLQNPAETDVSLAVTYKLMKIPFLPLK